MLWYKAWLETRWRFVAMMISTAAIVFLIPPLLNVNAQKVWVLIALEISLMNCAAALILAGSGINSQTSYSAVSGFHGSMFFTLSLPVSRRRLFAVRTGLGALETCAFVVMTTALVPLFHPETSFDQLLRYGARAVICSLAVYAFSAFLACFLDEMWQFSGGILLLSGFFGFESRFPPLSSFSPLRGLSLFPSSLAAPTPWALLFTSVALIGVFLFSSVYLLERKEY
jgi:ABC-2 type transport system permease protein